MVRVSRHIAFRRLYCAQFLELLGTGLITVALGLSAYRIAPDKAVTILGIIVVMKM